MRFFLNIEKGMSYIEFAASAKGDKFVQKEKDNITLLNVLNRYFSLSKSCSIS